MCIRDRSLAAGQIQLAGRTPKRSRAPHLARGKIYMKKKPIQPIPPESSDKADDAAMGSPPAHPVRQPAPDNPDEATGSLSRDPSEPPGNYGVRKPTFE